jgi:hypothetical protein
MSGAIETSHLETVEAFQQVVHTDRHEVDEPFLQRLLGGERNALHDRAFRNLRVAAAVLGQRPHHGRRIVGKLVTDVLGEVLPLPAHRVGGAGVGTRRHHRDIGGDEDEETGRCGPRTRRSHEDHNRNR